VDNLSWTKAKMDKTLGQKMVGLKKHGQTSSGQKKLDEMSHNRYFFWGGKLISDSFDQKKEGLKVA